MSVLISVDYNRKELHELYLHQCIYTFQIHHCLLINYVITFNLASCVPNIPISINNYVNYTLQNVINIIRSEMNVLYSYSLKCHQP